MYKSSTLKTLSSISMESNIKCLAVLNWWLSINPPSFLALFIIGTVKNWKVMGLEHFTRKKRSVVIKRVENVRSEGKTVLDWQASITFLNRGKWKGITLSISSSEAQLFFEIKFSRSKFLTQSALIFPLRFLFPLLKYTSVTVKLRRTSFDTLWDFLKSINSSILHK